LLHSDSAPRRSKKEEKEKKGGKTGGSRGIGLSKAISLGRAGEQGEGGRKKGKEMSRGRGSYLDVERGKRGGAHKQSHFLSFLAKSETIRGKKKEGKVTVKILTSMSAPFLGGSNFFRPFQVGKIGGGKKRGMRGEEKGHTRAYFSFARTRGISSMPSRRVIVATEHGEGGVKKRKEKKRGEGGPQPEDIAVRMSFWHPEDARWMEKGESNLFL